MALRRRPTPNGTHSWPTVADPQHRPNDALRSSVSTVAARSAVNSSTYRAPHRSERGVQVGGQFFFLLKIPARRFRQVLLGSVRSAWARDAARVQLCTYASTSGSGCAGRAALARSSGGRVAGTVDEVMTSATITVVRGFGFVRVPKFAAIVAKFDGSFDYIRTRPKRRPQKRQNPNFASRIFDRFYVTE